MAASDADTSFYSAGVVQVKGVPLTGTIAACLGNYRYLVRAGDHEAICTLSGKKLKAYIWVTLGDNVVAELSPYNLTRGRIVQRL